MKLPGLGVSWARQWLLAACFAIASASAALGPAVFNLVEKARSPFLNEEELFAIIQPGDGAVHKLSFSQFDRLEHTLPPDVGMGAWYLERRSVHIRNQGDVRLVARLTGKTMQTLGIVPIAGRGIEPEDDRSGSRPVALLSYNSARSWFGTPTGSLGKTIVIDKEPYNVVGVLPEGTALPRRDVSVWIAARPGLSVIVASRQVAVLEAIIRRPLAGSVANHGDFGLNSTLKTLREPGQRDDELILRPLKTVLDGGWSVRWRRIQFGLLAITILGISGVIVLVLGDMLRRIGECRLRLVLGSSSSRFAFDLGQRYLVTGVLASITGAVAAVLVAGKVAAVSKLPDAAPGTVSVFVGSVTPIVATTAAIVALAFTVPGVILV